MAAVAASLIAQGCGESSKSASEVLADSLSAYRAAQSFHVSGHFNQATHAYQIDLEVVRPDSVSGTVTVDGKQVELLQLGNQTFLKGRDYLTAQAGQSVAKLVGDRWVLYPSTDLAFALGEFASTTGPWGGLASGSPALDKQGEMKVNGVDSVKLVGQSTTFFVATQSPNYPTRVEGTGDSSNPAGIANFTLDFSDYNAKATIEKPQDFVNFSDPSTLPANFVVQTASIGPRCGNFGCTISATVRNAGGAGDGRIVFHLKAPDGTEIAHCASPIRGLASGQSRTVACWAYNPRFQSYVESYTIARFVVIPEVQNPSS